MAKQLVLASFLAILCFAVTCNAATYVVGDNSGWDVSTALDSWAQNKTFVVGDVLLFQYSSSYNVGEVTKQDFDGCNTTNPISIYTNGNTTVPLTKPGSRYFISGNKLYCLGGMKLQVNVEGDQANSPVGSPQAQPGNLPQPSSKSDNPSVPTSSGFSYKGRDALLIASLGFLPSVLLLLVQM